jgi:lysine-specific demethylase/histidyl-hydroxylase NO66
MACTHEAWWSWMTLPAFDLCVAPYELHAFVDRWWERKPLLIKRRDIYRFHRLITRSSFDDLVAHTNLRIPFFRLFRDGRPIPESACTTSRQVGRNTDFGLADLNSVYDGFNEGATVVLTALEKVHLPLTQLCFELETVFRCPFQAYAFLAPPEARGPPAHYDTRDVFVLQVEGSKYWRIWSDPSPLPMPVSENAYDHDAVIRFTENNTPILEVLLEPGDSLYLPRGFIHAAETSADYSLHLSISAMVVRWLDVVDTGVNEALASLKSDREAQRAFAFGRLPGEPTARVDDDAVVALAARLVAGLSVDQLMAIAKRSSEPPPCGSRSGALLDRLKGEATFTTAS